MNVKNFDIINNTYVKFDKFSMSSIPTRRRLAAILAADVAGFSRLMGGNEDRTLNHLKERRAITDESIVANNGRIFHTAGDSVVAEFASPVDAITAAVQFQKAIGALNSAAAESDRMQFRVGLNLGDVIVEDDNLYGDGVNVAARIEATCKPGGITVSAKFYEEVRRKLALSFESLGLQELKNIDEPVFTYRVILELGQGPPSNADAPLKTAEKRPAEPAPAAGFFEMPSIIVLPFTNMSGLPEQEFFADGLTEDVLTELSRFRELFVISRNTSFQFKGQAVDVKKIGREIKARYVLEGSVRKAANRVRITVQLIEAESDRHLWAERYDREMEDIFAIQDEVTAAIVSTLSGRLEKDIVSRMERKPPESLAAYECVLQAKLLHHRSTREDNAHALSLIKQAITIDPKYAHAHAWLACILGQQRTSGWSQDPAAATAIILLSLQTALELDPNDSDVHRILAACWINRGDLGRAAFHQTRALELNPNDDLIVVQQGELLTWMGKSEEGIYWIRKSMRLNPFFPERFWFHLARALFVDHRYAEAVESLLHIQSPSNLVLALLAGCYVQLGKEPSAAEQKAAILKREPGFNMEQHCLPTLHFSHKSDLAHYAECLRNAGLARGA